MKERPILFSGPMVLALLRDPSDPLCKTETRRVVKWRPSSPGDVSATREPDEAVPRVTGYAADGSEITGREWAATWREPSGTSRATTPCPYGVPGDRLWVREAHAIATGHMYDGEAAVRYFADGALRSLTDERSNATARSLSVSRRRPSIHMPRWASRLTLSVESVRVERLHDIDDAGARREGVADREAYRALWEDINGAGSWDSNPWVWVVGFRRVTS